LHQRPATPHQVSGGDLRPRAPLRGRAALERRGDPRLVLGRGQGIAGGEEKRSRRVAASERPRSATRLKYRFHINGLTTMLALSTARRAPQPVRKLSGSRPPALITWG